MYSPRSSLRSSPRGQWRGGSRGYAPRGPLVSATLPPGRSMMDGLITTAIDSFDKRALGFIGLPGNDIKGEPTSAPRVDVPKEVAIKDLEYIGSYNWVDTAAGPEIIVPGSPRVWKNRTVPFTVEADGNTRKEVFIDQNSARLPSALLLPLIESVDTMVREEQGGADAAGDDEQGAGFDWPSVDIVTDRNGLRKLIRWLEDSPIKKDFRIDVQLGGERTVLMSRWEPRTSEPASTFSFGFNFEHATSDEAEGCEGDSGYHRIVTYDFNGLKMVVRFEVDGCLPAAAPKTQSTMPATVDDLATLLSRTELSAAARALSPEPARLVPTPSGPPLAIRPGGARVVQSRLIEVTTRSERNAVDFDWSEAFPQLFLAQTPHHFMGVHQRGTFHEVRRSALGAGDMRAIEAAAQPAFGRLRVVLEAIQELVVERGKEVRLSLVCRDDVLRVYERTSKQSCLPEKTLAKFGQ